MFVISTRGHPNIVLPSGRSEPVRDSGMKPTKYWSLINAGSGRREKRGLVSVSVATEEEKKRYLSLFNRGL